MVWVNRGGGDVEKEGTRFSAGINLSRLACDQLLICAYTHFPYQPYHPTSRTCRTTQQRCREQWR